MTRSSRGATATSSSMTKARRHGLHEAVDTEELLRMSDYCSMGSNRHLRGATTPRPNVRFWVKSRQHTCLQAVLTHRWAALTGGPTDMPELQKHRATFGWHAASPTT